MISVLQKLSGVGDRGEPCVTSVAIDAVLDVDPQIWICYSLSKALEFSKKTIRTGHSLSQMQFTSLVVK